MSAQSPKGFHSPEFDVGSGYKVEFTYTEGRIDCEWTPDFPDNAADRAAVLKPYRHARDAFLEAVAGALGIRIGVIDLAGDTPS